VTFDDTFPLNESGCKNAMHFHIYGVDHNRQSLSLVIYNNVMTLETVILQAMKSLLTSRAAPKGDIQGHITGESTLPLRVMPA